MSSKYIVLGFGVGEDVEAKYRGRRVVMVWSAGGAAVRLLKREVGLGGWVEMW